MEIIILAILIFIIFFILSIVIHELGHLVCGLVSGYKFSSFRIFSFVWFKEDEKIMFKISKGVLAGQCLMSPPKNEDKFKFVLYNLGGGIFNLLAAIIMFVININFSGIVSDILNYGIGINVVQAIINLVPMSMLIPNDGLNVITALQSKESKRGLFLMLSVNDETAKGKRYRDLDPNIFIIKNPANYKNFFVAYIVMMEAARLYDIGEYDKSIEQYSCLDMDKMQQYYKNSIKLEFLYYYIVHKPDFKKAKEIYEDKKIKSYLKLELPNIIRSLAAYEYFINDNKEKAKLLLEKAKISIENIPNKGYRDMERDYCVELGKLFN